MGKATGKISQRAISVKLNKEEIEILDVLVNHGLFNGRSHFIRFVLNSYFNYLVTVPQILQNITKEGRESAHGRPPLPFYLL